MRLVLLLFASWCAGLGQLCPAATAQPREVSFLALGDSYTIGEGVRAAEQWPRQLAELAWAEGLRLQPPRIIARTGWTTADLQAAAAAVAPRRPYGLVSLLIGVNNQYQGLGVEAYRFEFRQLLRTAVGLAGKQTGHVVVLSVPDWGQSPYAQRRGFDPVRIGRDIDQFNQAAREECRAAGIAFVDITPLTRAGGADAAQFAPDGLHYSGLQMQRWAAQVLPVVRRLLQ